MVNVYYIDLFCGAGGTSTGVHMSRANAKVIACVNHDINAIKSHRANHPKCKHFTEDIKDFKVVLKIKKIVDKLRKTEPNCIIIIWASLDCTNHSRAKGGQSKDADSRTLAFHLYPYIEVLKPDYLKIENVEEFLDWGPTRLKEGKSSTENFCELAVNKKGKYIIVPDKTQLKIFYNQWVKKIKDYGFNYDYRLLDSADFGSYTTRERYFGQFAKKGFPIAWPKPTHAKNPTRDLFGEELKKWNPVKDVLDLGDEGKSIFQRKKQLCDNTLKVIYKGIIKSLKEKQDCFLYKYYGNGDNLNSINDPAGTIPTKDRFGKIQIIYNQYGNGNTTSLDNPSGTLLKNPKQNVLTFILNPSYQGHTSSIEKPCPVIIARQDKSPLYLIQAFMKENGISDIKMRMLRIDELLKIQGFPENYKLIGTQTDQKKFIGNSVVPVMAQMIVEANYESIVEYLNAA